MEEQQEVERGGEGLQSGQSGNLAIAVTAGHVIALQLGGCGCNVAHSANDDQKQFCHARACRLICQRSWRDRSWRLLCADGLLFMRSIPGYHAVRAFDDVPVKGRLEKGFLSVQSTIFIQCTVTQTLNSMRVSFACSVTYCIPALMGARGTGRSAQRTRQAQRWR